jgi:hypothetical protein
MLYVFLITMLLFLFINTFEYYGKQNWSTMTKSNFLSRITQNKVLQKINTKKTKLKLLKIPITRIVNIICPSHTSTLLIWTMLTFGSYGPPPHLGIEFYWNIMISSCRETNLFLCLRHLVLHRLRAESFGTLLTMVSCKHWHPKTKCQK